MTPVEESRTIIQVNWQYGPEAFWTAFRHAIAAKTEPEFLAALDTEADEVCVTEKQARIARKFFRSLPEWHDGCTNEAFDFIEDDGHIP